MKYNFHDFLYHKDVLMSHEKQAYSIVFLKWGLGGGLILTNILDKQ